MVNLGVGAHSKTPNHRKISEKRKKMTTYWKSSDYLNRNISKWGPGLYV